MQSVSGNNFKNILNGDLPVLINFYSSEQLCSQTILDLLSSIKKITGNAVCILKVKIDRNDILVKKYQLAEINTMILFRYGQICWRSSVSVSKFELLKQIALYS